MGNFFNNKLINYIFLIYILFLCKDLFYKADIYNIKIKEKNNSIVNNYFSSNQFILDKNYKDEDNFNMFFYDKDGFYSNFSNYNIYFWKNQENFDLSNTILSNKNCYDEKLKFEEQIIKCSDIVTNYFLPKYFKKNNEHYVLIVDNSGHKNVYEFYKILAKYWSHKLTGIDLKFLTEDKQVVTLERDFVSIQFFIVKIVLVVSIYFVLNFVFYILKFEND